MSLKKAYIFLVFAVFTEVLATSCMKAGAGEYEIWGYISMYILLVFSYFFMAISLKRLSISVAYAIWEVLGVISVASVGIFYFGESLSWKEQLGIALSLCGIFLINLAELKHNKTDLEALTPSNTTKNTNPNKMQNLGKNDGL